MYDVLCTGLSSCDLIFSKLERMPEPGKEVLCEDFLLKPGGAANTPAALSKLGMRTMFATTIGKDILGSIVYEYLKKTGIDMAAVIYDEKFRTSVSSVLSVGNERGFASYFAPIDYKATMEQIEKHLPQCRHIHAYMLDCISMPDIIGLSKRYNRTISVDTAWDEAIKLGDIRDIVENSDIFFTNEIEAASITGKATAEEALNELSRYAKLVVLKLGSKGCIVRQGNKELRMPAAQVEEVKDTTGAGDLFAAGFLYGYLKGWDMEKTARFASASGSAAVTFYGGVDESYCLEYVNKYF